MARADGQKAGNAIQRSAEKYVRDSVRVEENAWRKFREALDHGVPTARTVVRRAWDAEPRTLADVATVSRLTDLHAAALMRALGSYEVALREILVLAVRSAQRELRWVCRYAAPEDVPIVNTLDRDLQPLVDGYVREGLDRARQGVLVTADVFRGAVIRQALLARDADDPTDVVEARILHPEQVRAEGISGRGVWWRSADSLISGLTTTSVGAANQTKIEALKVFNEKAVA